MERGNRPSLADVKFRYQKDPVFQALVDLGIGTGLAGSGYCWAASIDMALSPFIVDDKVRLRVITDSVRHERLATDTFTAAGGLQAGRLEDFVGVVNETLSTAGLHPRLKLIRGQILQDLHVELQRGRVVIFGLGDEEGKHAMVMDKVLVDGGKYIYLTYDPDVEDPTKARQSTDNFGLYGLIMFSDIKPEPFIISVGEEEK